MKKLFENPVLYVILMAVVVIVYMFLITFLWKPTPKIDCSLAEISPDFTTEQRQLCRTMRATKL